MRRRIEDRGAARQKADQLVAKLKEMKLADAAEHVRRCCTTVLLRISTKHWQSLRTNDPLERILREVLRRTRAVRALPDGKPASKLAPARLRHVTGMKWGTRRYLDRNRLAEASEAARDAS